MRVCKTVHREILPHRNTINRRLLKKSKENSARDCFQYQSKLSWKEKRLRRTDLDSFQKIVSFPSSTHPINKYLPILHPWSSSLDCINCRLRFYFIPRIFLSDWWCKRNFWCRCFKLQTVWYPVEESIGIKLDGLKIEAEHKDDDCYEKNFRSKKDSEKMGKAWVSRSIENPKSKFRQNLHLRCTSLL